MAALAGYVLEMRSFNRKASASGVRTSRSPSMTPRVPANSTFIVKLKSHIVKEFILAKKRAKRELTRKS